MNNKQKIFLIFINIILFTIVAALFEIAVRKLMHYNVDFPTRLKINVLYQPSGFISHIPVPNQIIYNVNKKGRLDTNKIKLKINQYGLRGNDFPVNKKENEIRIIIMGGSHVFDANSMEYEGNAGFPGEIEKIFREEGFNITVINAGVPGYDSRCFIQKLSLDLYRFQPDIGILNSIWNDLKWIWTFSDSAMVSSKMPQSIKPNPLIERVNIFDKLLGSSIIYRKFRDYYWKKKLRIKNDHNIIENSGEEIIVKSSDLRKGFLQYTQNYLFSIQIIKEMNALPIIAIEERLVHENNSRDEIDMINFKYIRGNITHNQLVNLFNNCESILTDIAKDRNILCINTNRKMEDRKKYFVDHVHMSPEGSHFVAEDYYQFLKPYIEKLSIR